MTKRTFQLIALSSLPLPVAGAYVLGRPVAGALASLWSEMSTLLSLLGYLLALLLTVLVWGACLLPLRRRAGFVPIGQELQQLRHEGLANAVAREQAAQAERRRSSDPAVRAAHHSLVAPVAGLLSLGALGLTWVLYEDGYVAALPLAAALTLLASLAAGTTVAYARENSLRTETFAAAYALSIDPWRMHGPDAAPVPAGHLHP